MHQFARLKFASFALRVPPNWQDPQGDPDADHYSKASKPAWKATMPDMTITPPLFTPATPNKMHTDTQKMLTYNFDKYMHDILAAISDAWDQWQMMASMAGIMVMGPVATLGQLVGPPLMPLILKNTALLATPDLAKFTKVIATVISNSWMQFTATVKIPGLPFWPAFTMVTLPVAPPMPNTPVPFATLMQVPVSISAEMMKQQMVMQLGDPNAPFASQLFASICDAFEKAYDLWKVATMVSNVMGTGPVPTFAPPYVPGGPVVGGTGMMAPGGLTGKAPDMPPLPMPPEWNPPQGEIS
jgi:hypothetical protein